MSLFETEETPKIGTYNPELARQRRERERDEREKAAETATIVAEVSRSARDESAKPDVSKADSSGESV